MTSLLSHPNQQPTDSTGSSSTTTSPSARTTTTTNTTTTSSSSSSVAVTPPRTTSTHMTTTASSSSSSTAVTPSHHHHHHPLTSFTSQWFSMFRNTTSHNTPDTTTSSLPPLPTRKPIRVPRSPFFQPSTPFPISVVQTPGGTQHIRKGPRRTTTTTRTTTTSTSTTTDDNTTMEPTNDLHGRMIDEEHKSTLMNCTANLINAIVGSGIVGIPYAIQQSGFCTGVALVILCAFLTEKSLRILVETAKHVQVPTYETLCETVFGKFGFVFISINMFFLAYGAMMSYLMIVKDTFGHVLGLQLVQQRRALLFCISLLVIVPLSSRRDMADLAYTSRFNVLFDVAMVMIVVYVSPMKEQVQVHGGLGPVISNSLYPHWNTVFVGLGVLSFAFVCQHSAFIIAGSLQQPTRQRWKHVTQTALAFSAFLAILCGTCGFLGYLDQTQGNVLNNLQSNPILSNVARSLLGTSMLFVYPMESFVARHVCVVLLFQGRRAHEGEDSTILARRDRRITLTVALYIMALIPAMLFENLGKVLAATGAVGGSCISYIGVGAVYLGVYGAEFLQISEPWQHTVHEQLPTLLRIYWQELTCRNRGKKSDIISSPSTPIVPGYEKDEETEEFTPLQQKQQGADHHALSMTMEQSTSSPLRILPSWSVVGVAIVKAIGWYTCLMPLWTWLATLGTHNLSLYKQSMVGKSPHISRIDSRVGQRILQSHCPHEPGRKYDDDDEQNGNDIKGGNLKSQSSRGNGTIGELGLITSSSSSNKIVVRTESGITVGSGAILPPKSHGWAKSYQLQQQYMAAKTETMHLVKKSKANTATKATKELLKKGEDHKEDDNPPVWTDFLIAIGYILFGLVALIVGLASLS